MITSVHINLSNGKTIVIPKDMIDLELKGETEYPPLTQGVDDVFPRYIYPKTLYEFRGRLRLTEEDSLKIIGG